MLHWFSIRHIQFAVVLLLKHLTELPSLASTLKANIIYSLCLLSRSTIKVYAVSEQGPSCCQV